MVISRQKAKPGHRTVTLATAVEQRMPEEGEDGERQQNNGPGRSAAHQAESITYHRPGR